MAAPSGSAPPLMGRAAPKLPTTPQRQPRQASIDAFNSSPKVSVLRGNGASGAPR
ncbi:hypothetical protein HUJ04_000153 [Dendroctonus ponderosae]|nr:hypothetical protein HUJ04_000153 [Dendroctonus ponderosae]